MMEQKINEENIENNLVFCIDPRKAFAIKSVFRNPLHQNKVRLFSISVKFRFRFLYKTMTKQTVYLNNIARKSGFRLHYLRQSAFQTHHYWRSLMTSPMSIRSRMSLIMGQVIPDQSVLSALEIEKLKFSSLVGMYIHCLPVLLSTQVSDIGPSYSSCFNASLLYLDLELGIKEQV